MTPKPNTRNTRQKALPYARSPAGAQVCLLTGLLSHAGIDAITREPIARERTVRLVIDAACYGPRASALRWGLSEQAMKAVLKRYPDTARALSQHRLTIATALADCSLLGMLLEVWQLAGTIRMPTAMTQSWRQARERVTLLAALTHALSALAAISDRCRNAPPQAGPPRVGRELRQLSAALDRVQTAQQVVEADVVQPDASSVNTATP